MRQRFRHPAVALFCILAQLALGASSLGLVLCTGRDHAGIELKSDACCGSHAQADARPTGPALEDSCCSDTPLFAADRRVSDVPRSQPPPAPVFLAWIGAAGGPSLRPDPRGAAEREVSAPDRLARRVIVLRV
jgi:hypothetical protein